MALEAFTIETLTVRRQFLHCAQGLKASGRFALLQARSTADPVAQARGAIRFGLTASKKVGNAVKRNRARRRLRAAMFQLLPLYGKPGIDYVAVARTATTEAEWADLLDDLTRLFIKLSKSLSLPSSTPTSQSDATAQP
jgi:ribonuclease P protein component